MASGSSNLKYGFPTPGPQRPSGEKVMEHLFFLNESEWKRAREEKNYDLIIVGSGFCALAVADRALENNPRCRVLIVERGTLFLPEHFQNLPQPFSSTIGGLSETFPWTLSADTANGGAGVVRWQHGMVPFFGGRSTLWSAWCPEPTDEELNGWPDSTKKVIHEYFPAAKQLLNVQSADKVDAGKDSVFLNLITKQRPVYGVLQHVLQKLLRENGTDVEGVYRTEPAPLASDGRDTSGVDFLKFSVPGEMLKLVSKHAACGTRLDIVTNCVVEKIYQQDGTATALQTSRGVLPIGKAKLVLAMGSLPPATLVRNSFPQITNAGERFSAHFITSVVARVPREDLEGIVKFGELELGAFYIGGKGKDYSQQYHIQLSALSDKAPETNSGTALRYMPDVVATASMAQLLSSRDHVIFVCAVLGELDALNPKTWFRSNPDDPDITTNSLLQVNENESDMETWDAMDKATFEILEQTLSPRGASRVEYWHGGPEVGKWTSERPTEPERRVDAMVHESSTLHIGEEETAPVDLDYRLRKTENVFVTGGALWPLGGSWNPTPTMVALAQHLTDQLVPKKSPRKK